MANKHILLKHPSGKVAEIKIGFSWPACLLGPLWALVKRLWLHMSVLLLIGAILNTADVYAEHLRNKPLILLSTLLFFVYMYVCGRYGNAWLHSTLLKRGYLPVMNKEENA